MPGTMRQPQRRFAATCVLIAVLAGCAVPAPRNGIGGGAAAVAAPAPRFAAGGPDAEEYGAAQGFPMGERTTFFTVPFLLLFVLGYWYTGLLSLLQGRFERFSMGNQEMHEKPYPMGI